QSAPRRWTYTRDSAAAVEGDDGIPNGIAVLQVPQPAPVAPARDRSSFHEFRGILASHGRELREHRRIVLSVFGRVRAVLVELHEASALSLWEFVVEPRIGVAAALILNQPELVGVGNFFLRVPEAHDLVDGRRLAGMATVAAVFVDDAIEVTEL